jgi:hypothetical protein
MFDKKTETRIIDAVRAQPRTVQEIAVLLGKNWRTAERYVEKIATESGLIATRTFREGTRGALKIVYWNALDRAKGSAHQERLLGRILHATRKEDFSPFDIYQFVPEADREAFVEKTEFPRHPRANFDTLIGGAKEQVLSFSGNLSWTEFGPERMRTLEALARRKVKVKILTRIDITSMESARKALAINQRVGWDAVEIRHCEQPLRAVIVDDALVSIKESFSPLKVREVREKTFLFYIIKDVEWVGWLQKVFWHLWEQSIDAEMRLVALGTITRAPKRKK